MYKRLQVKSIVLLCFYVTLFISILSQNFILRKSVPLETICDFSWMIMLVIVLMARRLKLRWNKFLGLYIFCIVYNLLLISVLKNAFVYGKYSFSISTFLPAPFLVYLISLQIMNLLCDKPKNTDQLFYALIISGLVFSFSFISMANINWSSWVNSYVYVLNDGKNAIGHILGILILIFLFYSPSNTIKKRNAILYRVVGGLFVMLALMIIVYVQCRTVLFTLVVVVVFKIGSSTKSFKLKIAACVCAVIIGIAFVLSRNLNTILIHALYLDKYNDINSFSSGRIDSYILALKVWGQYFLFGVPGTYYVDDFYLNQLAGNGIIGAASSFILLFIRVRLNIKACKNKIIYEPIRNVIMIATLYELIISLVEALPPFGPGVSVLVFWIISAMADFLSEKRPCFINMGN